MQNCYSVEPDAAQFLSVGKQHTHRISQKRVGCIELSTSAGAELHQVEMGDDAIEEAAQRGARPRFMEVQDTRRLRGKARTIFVDCCGSS